MFQVIHCQTLETLGEMPLGAARSHGTFGTLFSFQKAQKVLGGARVQLQKPK